VRERVVLELTLRDIQRLCVGIRVTLVRVELMERLLLVLLRPTTVRTVHTTVDTRCIRANRRERTTLLESRLTNVHTTSVAHAVRLTAAILGAETVLHELLVRLRSNLRRSGVRIRTTEVCDTGLNLVVVVVLRVVAITLETRGVLGHSLSGYETLRAVETETICANTSLRAVRGTFRLFVFVTRDDTGHALRPTRHDRPPRG